MQRARRFAIPAHGKSRGLEASGGPLGPHRDLGSIRQGILGWTEGREGRHFYVRQLHDMKIKLLVELFTVKVMVQYAEYCGWALARAHARAGQPSLIAGYLGKGDEFDEAPSRLRDCLCRAERARLSGTGERGPARPYQSVHRELRTAWQHLKMRRRNKPGEQFGAAFHCDSKCEVVVRILNKVLVVCAIFVAGCAL